MGSSWHRRPRSQRMGSRPVARKHDSGCRSWSRKDRTLGPASLLLAANWPGRRIEEGFLAQLAFRAGCGQEFKGEGNQPVYSEDSLRFDSLYLCTLRPKDWCLIRFLPQPLGKLGVPPRLRDSSYQEIGMFPDFFGFSRKRPTSRDRKVRRQLKRVPSSLSRKKGRYWARPLPSPEGFALSLKCEYVGQERHVVGRLF